MTWHPSLSDVDPAEGWFDRDRLDALQREEDEYRRFRVMLERRTRFQRALAAADDPNPEEVRDMWAIADEEARDATL